MNSFEDTQRQLRFAVIAIAIIFPVGIIGYMVIEGLEFMEAFWLTIITLGTVGYGDIVPTTDLGRIFTVFLVITGLGSVALAAQAGIVFFVSPNIRIIRQRRRAYRKIDSLKNHYVICGEGELVDKTINYLLRRAELRRAHQQEAIAAPLDARLYHIFGRKQHGVLAFIRKGLRKIIMGYLMLRYNSQTILDVIVVVTNDDEYAMHLHDNNILVIEDDPTDDRALRRAGIVHAQAVLCILDNDTDTVLTELTVRSRNPDVYITAATHDNALNLKLTRVGANNVLVPFELAGQFLNNTTLRPAVNDFFNSIIFDQKASSQIVQLYLGDSSPWIGKAIGTLNLREHYQTAIIGVRMEDGHYIYAPDDDYIVREDEVLLTVAPGPMIAIVQQACCAGSISGSRRPNWQRLPEPHLIRTSEKHYSLIEAKEAITHLSHHYVICGSGPVITHALDNLNPERPFVVLSNNPTHTSEMLERGFRVVQGDPTQDDALRRAGVDRALAIMISIEDRGDSVLTVLNARILNKDILITATASTDDLVPKLRRAGADRVMSPYRTAAQFVLLATTRPAVSDFLQYVVFNYRDKVETTELYMQDNSTWIGQRISDLNLRTHFNAGVIGIRTTSGRFIYGPPMHHTLSPHEVMIVIVPMAQADDLRLTAHGGGSRRPRTLRN